MDLVTGATGFVGPHLVDALVARGRRVLCLRARRATGRVAPTGPASTSARASSSTETRLTSAMQGVERVFHQAGGGKVSTASREGLDALRAANVAPLESVLRAARSARVRRVVHFSSISAMGVQLGRRLDESTPCRAETCRTRWRSTRASRWRSRRAARECRSSFSARRRIYGPGGRAIRDPQALRSPSRVSVPCPCSGGGEGRVRPWACSSPTSSTRLSPMRQAEHARSTPGAFTS